VPEHHHPDAVAHEDDVDDVGEGLQRGGGEEGRGGGGEDKGELFFFFETTLAGEVDCGLTSAPGKS
jgi:hypothetical protein